MAAFPNSESRISNPSLFGRVAVVMGGQSAEREVSLDSGRNVLEALRSKGVDAHAVDGIPALLDALRAGHYARVFNILHGQHGGGEDGVLQGALESLHVPYTGSGVLGSALSMDKVRSKWVWIAQGLPTPRFVPLRKGDDVHAAAAKLGLPVIVKPSSEGSSVGITRVFEERDLDAAVDLAARYPGDLLVESLIEGDELTVSILGREALPSIRIVPKGAFYDYHAKYVAEDTQYLCPGLDGAAEEEIRALALAAFDALGCSGWGRVDVMRDRAGRNWLLEANTAPGMTSHSLVPKAAKQVGIDFGTLCWRILETSFEKDQESGIGNRESKGSSRAHSPFPIPHSRASEGGAK
ncbi:MAG TPA: D-alanine--D-alanine ligase [Rhodanobacteraceae bacterium]|jgi:D-alanine-D-alanine ligase|nr:D-alanine--D-alanine ligase [Rhodanobacteraceae bacterium]